MGPLKQNYIMNQELSQRNSGNGTGGLCYFFKMQSSCLPQYLNDLIPKPSLCYITRFSLFPKFRTKIFWNSFFLYAVNECNNLDNIIKLSELYIMFRKRMLNLIIPKYNETYGIHNPTVLKLLTRMRLGLSHYNYNKFNQNFRDCINPLCPCSLSLRITFTLFCTAIIFHCKDKTFMTEFRRVLIIRSTRTSFIVLQP